MRNVAMSVAFQPLRDWLPAGKRAAVCFTIDDVHPGKSSEHYDGGGDLAKGALGHVQALLDRHPYLRVTLFTTADWREISPSPSRLLSRIPVVRDRLYLSRVLPPGTRQIDRHPEFVSYLRSLPRTEIGLHGLHHIHTGPLLHVEFQDEPEHVHREKLERMLAIFDASKLPYVRGMCPPGWNAPPSLLRAMDALGFEFVASARDIKTEISADATASMSGLKGAPLLYPARIDGTRLLHFATNFQATSRYERARAIVEGGGLVAVKAHIIKDALGYVALDGVDAVYCNFLDLLFERLHREYGESLWWTTMGEIAQRARAQSAEKAS
jgi:hypothetical protein